jgi:hypothetical protein
MKCGGPAGSPAWLLQKTKVIYFQSQRPCRDSFKLGQLSASGLLLLSSPATAHRQDVASMHMRTRSIISSICDLVNTSGGAMIIRSPTAHMISPFAKQWSRKPCRHPAMHQKPDAASGKGRFLLSPDQVSETIASISTSTSRGNRATCTVERAGQ